MRRGSVSSSETVRSVLIVTPRWVRDGGVGAHMMTSAAALAREGIRVSVLTARIEAEEEVPGVRVHHSPRLFKTTRMDERFEQALSSNPDVIHLNQFDELDAVDHLRLSAPVVLSAHGYLACTSGVHYFGPGEGCTRAHGPGCVPNLIFRGCAHTRDPRWLPSSYRQATIALSALRRADLAISYSHAMDAHLRVNEVSRRRIVPYFPTLEAGAASGHERRRRVVFAGRIVPSKGAGTLIRAVRGLEAELVVCGDGWQLPSLRRLARRVGVEDRVRFRGWLAPAELAREFAEASVVVVPSLWPEPFGLVGIEAFAAGRPVIASATGGIPEWLQDGVSGRLVPAGDVRALSSALSEMLADPERQRTMGEAGRASVAERYTSAHHVAAVTEAYRAARARWASERGASPVAVGL
jgi:glycosyltransferase involved in cell wall biosynthesis